MATAQEVFTQTVSGLPPVERLRLAALILQELAQGPESAVWSDAWSDEDQRDLQAFAMQYADARYPEEQDLV